MNYLLPVDLFQKLTNNEDFVRMNGNTYSEYIANNISLSEILSELIFTSDSPEDALELLNFFSISFTHNYFQYTR